MTLGSLTHTYDGTPKSATATTDPASLTVVITYDGDTTAPTNAGSYTVVGTIYDDNYAGQSSGTMTIAKADATIDVVDVIGYNVEYDGNPHTATGTAKGVNGEDLSDNFDFSGTIHTDVGDYPSDPWYFDGGTNYNDDSGTIHDVIRGHVVNYNISGATGIWNLNESNVLKLNINATSPDGSIKIEMSAGTIALGTNGSIDDLSVAPVEPVPAAPTAGDVVLEAFEFEPAGATFDPGIQITIAFNTSLATGKTVKIAYYNEGSGKWEYIDGTVNLAEGTATFVVTHFSTYGVLGIHKSGGVYYPPETSGESIPTDYSGSTWESTWESGSSEESNSGGSGTSGGAQEDEDEQMKAPQATATQQPPAVIAPISYSSSGGGMDWTRLAITIVWAIVAILGLILVFRVLMTRLARK